MEKCLTSIDKRMQKRYTPRILESMNDMDLLSRNDMREATPLLLLAVHWDKEVFILIWKSSVECRPCLLIHAARRRYLCSTECPSSFHCEVFMIENEYIEKGNTSFILFIYVFIYFFFFTSVI